MSRSLIDQMEEIQLFSHVLRVGSEERAEDLLEQGAAAVITIPQFFSMSCALCSNWMAGHCGSFAAWGTPHAG